MNKQNYPYRHDYDRRPRQTFARRWAVEIEFDDPDRRATYKYNYVVNANDKEAAQTQAKETFFMLEGRTLPIGRGEWRYVSTQPV